jgi:hypothetical protein
MPRRRREPWCSTPRLQNTNQEIYYELHTIISGGEIMFCTKKVFRPSGPFGLGILWTVLSLAVLPAFGQHVHQLSYNGSTWVDQNLGGGQAYVFSQIASILTTPNNQEHVYYFAGSPWHVHQLFFNGTSWSDEDLTVETGAPLPNEYAVSAFSVGNYQYVYYTDLNYDLHQLLYNNSTWADTDLTKIVQGPQAFGQLVAFTTSPAVHVFYKDVNTGHVHQIFNTNGTNWQDQDLTVTTGGAAGDGNAMTGFHIGNFQYLYFFDVSGHVHQYLYNNSSWSDEDLTALTHTLPSAYGNNVDAYVPPGSNKLIVYVQAGNNHILQLSSTNNVKWSSSDLTKNTKTSPAYPGTSMAGFYTASIGFQVYYMSGQGDVDQFLLSPHATAWENMDLTTESGGTGVTPEGGISVLSLRKLPVVFYLGD